MSKQPLRHAGDGNSGLILITSSPEGMVRLEIVPMSDKPFVDIPLSQLMRLIATVKVKFMNGEI